MVSQRLTRSSSDKIIGGVCGGLGHYFGLDPVIVRLIMVALVFAGGISFLLYPILWLVTPAEGAQQPLIGQGFEGVQREAQAFGQQASQQFQSTFNTPRFDPQTGQPITSVQNERRNRTLGIILLGVGVLMLASFFDSTPLVIALMVIGGGLYLVRRTK